VAADGVPSNIVGYGTTPLSKGMNMVGVNFKEVGKPSGDLQTLFLPSGLVGVNWGTLLGGDQLMVWDPAAQGYPIFYTWTGADADTELGETGVANKWVDLNTFDGTPSTLPVIDLSVGGAAWIVTESASASFISHGEVKEDATGIPLLAGMNMIANTLPIDINLNSGTKMVFNGLAAVDWGTLLGGDQLMVWDSTAQGYPIFYTWTGADADTELGETGVSNKWVDLNTFDGTSATVPVIDLSINGAVWVVRSTGSSASVDIPGL